MKSVERITTREAARILHTTPERGRVILQFAGLRSERIGPVAGPYLWNRAAVVALAARLRNKTAEGRAEVARLTEQCRKIADEKNLEITALKTNQELSVRLIEKMNKDILAREFTIADLNKEIEKLRAENKELLDELPM